MPLAKGRVLSSILKCSRCRRDKAKCLPENRQWPGEPCNRCARYGYECSEGTPSKAKKCPVDNQTAVENTGSQPYSHGEASSAGQSQQLVCLPWMFRSMPCGEASSLSSSEPEMTERTALLNPDISNEKLDDSVQDGDENVEDLVRNISSEDRHIIGTFARRSPPARPNRIVRALRRTGISRSSLPQGVRSFSRTITKSLAPLLEPSRPGDSDPTTLMLMRNIEETWTTGMQWLGGVNDRTRQTINDTFRWQLRQMAASDEMIRHALLALAAAVVRDEIIKQYPPRDNEVDSPQSKRMWVAFAEHVGSAIKSLKSHMDNISPRNALLVTVTLFLLGFASLGEATIAESSSFINMFQGILKYSSAFPLRMRLGNPNNPCTGCGKLFAKKIVVYNAAHPEDLGGVFHT